MEALVILLVLVIVVEAAAFWHVAHSARAQDAAALAEARADLLHLTRQLGARPQPCERHVWPREPLLRKPGWLQYKCVACGDRKWVKA